ncbi:Pre-mRNA-splicing factor of RES complex-domain-containing protein [Spinellus fusiger]|nr:Pre-mRNA-splicing factor of RES complex-domain-containing protein [Spinellus fusiger]
MDIKKSRDHAKQIFLAKGVGDTATKEYIANKYLSSGTDEKRKKKRKITPNKIRRGNIGIVDEEESGWKRIGTRESNDDDNEIDKEQLRQYSLLNSAKLNDRDQHTSTTATTPRTGAWQTIREREEEEESESDEDKPVVVSQEDAGGPRMSSGQKAGLLTSDDLKAEALRTRALEQQTLQQLKEENGAQTHETVYRDASGRKIDPKIKRAEEARAKKEADEKEARRMEWGKGLVQREEAAAALQRLKEEKDKPLARYADDEDLNQDLKDKDRWNDPAAGFLTKKTKTKGKSVIRPSYKGPWKPNRFMIPPGYRWDGVDRSSGFEDTFLLHLNQKKSRATEAHMWSTEDM